MSEKKFQACLLSVEKMNKNRARHTKLFGTQTTQSRPSEVSTPAPVSSISSYSLADKIVEIYDQGEIGSCTANAVCQAFNIVGQLQKASPATACFAPSRLYLYYQERLMEAAAAGEGPSDLTDSGADAADGLHWIAKHGICSEAEWPYITNLVEVAPPAPADQSAASHKIAGIAALCPGQSAPDAQTLLKAIRSTLSAGYPILIGIQVYDSFMAAGDGNIPLPLSTETLQGGHEILLVGYNDQTETVTFANSWGSGWGQSGLGQLPYAYVTDSTLTQEFRYFTRVVSSASA